MITKYEYFGLIPMRQFAIRDQMTERLFTDIDNKRPSIMRKITQKTFNLNYTWISTNLISMFKYHQKKRQIKTINNILNRKT